MAYLKGIVELYVPAPCMRLLGPTETAIPPFSKLIAAGLPFEYASLDADDVAGAIRPHRETRIGEDRAVRDGCDIGSPLHVNTAGIEGDGRIIDEGMAGVRAARQIDAVPGEMPDRAADDIDLFEGGNAHAIKARPKSLDVEPFKFLDRFT